MNSSDLQKLTLDLFTVDELRLLVADLPDADELEHTISWNDASATVVARLVDALMRRDAVEDYLTLMARKRSRRFAAIDRVARGLGVHLVAPPRPGLAPEPVATPETAGPEAPVYVPQQPAGSPSLSGRWRFRDIQGMTGEVVYLPNGAVQGVGQSPLFGLVRWAGSWSYDPTTSILTTHVVINGLQQYSARQLVQWKAANQVEYWGQGRVETWAMRIG